MSLQCSKKKAVTDLGSATVFTFFGRKKGMALIRFCIIHRYKSTFLIIYQL